MSDPNDIAKSSLKKQPATSAPGTNSTRCPSKTKSRRTLVQCATLGLYAKIMESAVLANADCTPGYDDPANGVSYLMS